MNLEDAPILLTVALLLFSVGAIIQNERRRGRIRQGEWTGASADQITDVLWGEYLAGRVDPVMVARLEGKVKRSFAANKLVCLEIAAGRYAEALAIRTQEKWKNGFGLLEQLVRINEAEALACLGRLEEALAHVDFRPDGALLVAGLAAHRAWVLSELGRVSEARAALTEGAKSVYALGPFEAEWHFARAFVELADRRWESASTALNDAEAVVQRESSTRNLWFLRGRVAFAQGALTVAVSCFERGAASPYRWQGGQALLDWGDALLQLGNGTGAHEKWTWCVEQDGQSPAAAIARERLAQRSAAELGAPA